MPKKIATHIATLLVGLALGLGAVAVASQPKAHTSSEAAMLTQLRNMNRKLNIVNKNLGGYTVIAPYGGSIHQLLQHIDRNTSP